VAGNVPKCLFELLGARQILTGGCPVTPKNIDANDASNRLVGHFWRANPGHFSRVPKAVALALARNPGSVRFPSLS
jgi:hypothetical protein